MLKCDVLWWCDHEKASTWLIHVFLSYSFSRIHICRRIRIRENACTLVDSWPTGPLRRNLHGSNYRCSTFDDETIFSLMYLHDEQKKKPMTRVKIILVAGARRHNSARHQHFGTPSGRLRRNAIRWRTSGRLAFRTSRRRDDW